MNGTNRRAFLLALAASPLARAEAQAPTTSGHEPRSLDAVLAEVQRARAGMRTLRGPFVQERTIGLLASKVRATGTLALVRPDRLRWELAPPDEVTYWVGPEGLAYKSRSGQGRVRGPSAKIAAALDDLRTLLGGDLAELRVRYTLRLTDPGVTVEATPLRRENSGFQRILFTLADDLARPLRAVLVETPRDHTEITFGQLERDATIDPSLMRPPT
jgi:outer membrane lipoprotein-sorting protein